VLVRQMAVEDRSGWQGMLGSLFAA
jgi:hypothetical protein